VTAVTATPLRVLVRNYLRDVGPVHLLTVTVETYVGTLIRSLPGPEGVVLRWGLYRLLFRRLASMPYIYPGVWLSHTYGISAGKGLAINSGAFLYGRGGLELGDDVLIGPNAAVITSQHRFDDPRVPIVRQGHRTAPVTIGSDVWIGANAIVLPGVQVAEGTVVSAGAVVTHDTETYTIVGGVPARTIGERPRLPVASAVTR